MDYTELERLVEMVQNANVSELTLRQGDSRVTIRKRPPELLQSTALVPLVTIEEEGEEVYFAASDGNEDAAAATDESALITAPSVGVFKHIKPSVGLQARVKQGQVVGVIEGANLLSEVTSPTSGVVSDVLVEDGMAVEYGQRLFAVEEE